MERIKGYETTHSAVPRSCAQTDSVIAHTQATHSVLVSTQATNSLTPKHVPDLALKVIVTSKEQSSTHGESHRGDTAKDRITRILHQLSVGTDIEEPAASIITSSSKGVSVREELDSVDVALVSGKGLNGLASSDIPELGERIAGTGNEDILIRWIYADGHDITKMVSEFSNLGASLDIPEHTGHIARGSEDAAIIYEATAGEVSRMAGELTSDTSRSITRRQIIHGTNVVETTTGNVVSTRSVCAGHDP
jgi:hypothetical protein